MDCDATWSDIIKNNIGFDEPEKWIEYARRHGFKKVKATRILACPDCGTDIHSNAKQIGQYVYYSTLGHLQTCGTCGLLFSTIRISDEVVRQHFDRAYNDEQYFLRRRKGIFEQILRLTNRFAPLEGAVLDVGGAKGHLMASLKQLRPDLTVVVNDISRSKCEWAEREFRLQSICGTASELSSCNQTFDVITLIDVIYYEPNLSLLWSTIDRLLKHNGTVVVRVPNNYARIIVNEWLRDWCTPSSRRRMSDRIPYFNPEHLYVLSQRYLTKSFHRLGFKDVWCMPAALLRSEDGSRLLPTLHHAVAKILHSLMGHRAIVTPALIVVASRGTCS